MEIIFYSTKCPKCKVLEMKMQKKNIQYTENNDIDFIGHMNNTRYADALIFQGSVKHFEINFLHEVKLNEMLNIKYDDNNFIGNCENTISFKANCIYF